MPILLVAELRNSGTEQHPAIRSSGSKIAVNGTVLTACGRSPGDPRRYYINPAVLEATYSET